MSSAYGKIIRKSQGLTKDSNDELGMNSMRFMLLNSGKEVKLTRALDCHTDQLYDLLNHEITNGTTYPQETELNTDEFKNYFLSYDCFVVSYAKGEDATVLGTFYVTPNFPGRCSHVSFIGNVFCFGS